MYSVHDWSCSCLNLIRFKLVLKKVISLFKFIVSGISHKYLGMFAIKRNLDLIFSISNKTAKSVNQKVLNL